MLTTAASRITECNISLRHCRRRQKQVRATKQQRIYDTMYKPVIRNVWAVEHPRTDSVRHNSIILWHTTNCSLCIRGWNSAGRSAWRLILGLVFLYPSSDSTNRTLLCICSVGRPHTGAKNDNLHVVGSNMMRKQVIWKHDTQCAVAWNGVKSYLNRVLTESWNDTG